jgi:hypothetical protein
MKSNIGKQRLYAVRLAESFYRNIMHAVKIGKIEAGGKIEQAGRIEGPACCLC